MTYEEFLDKETKSWNQFGDDCTFHQWIEGVMECGDDEDYAYAKAWLAAKSSDELPQLAALVKVAENMGLHAAADALRNKFDIK